MADNFSFLTNLLFTPGNQPALFEKVKKSGADGIVIDLEDAVSVQDKEKARAAAIHYLKHANRASRFFHCLRINSLNTADGLKDVLALLAQEVYPDILLIAKVSSPDVLIQLDALFADKAMPYMAMIESAAAYHCLEKISQSSAHLIALVFGGGDLSVDLTADFSWEPLLFFRSALVAAAKASGLMAFDVPYIHLDDQSDSAIKLETRRSKALGFDGKMAIHPKQIKPIQAVFLPTNQEISRARKIIRVASECGGNACVVDGEMIDYPLMKQAKRILMLAEFIN